MKEILELKGKIKNIIFDFGGVLLELYPERTFDALTNLLGIELNLDSLSEEQTKILDDYEMGLMKDETFLWNLQRWAIRTPHPRAVINAWNAMLGGWKTSKIELLHKAKDHFNTYLLSNTNAIHINWVKRDLLQTHNISEFEKTFFEKAYYSHQVNMRKPNLDIFDYVIKDSCVDPSSTLFVDDNSSNVASAKDAGLHAVLHSRNGSLDYIFDLLE